MTYASDRRSWHTDHLPIESHHAQSTPELLECSNQDCGSGQARMTTPGMEGERRREGGGGFGGRDDYGMGGETRGRGGLGSI